MAWNFADQIHALTGFDADLTDDSETDTDFNLLANQWLVDAAKEVISVLPPKLKEKCSTITVLNNSATTMDLDGVGEVLYITRLSANSSGYYRRCRQIPPTHGDLSNDSASLYYATVNDPVYWITSNSSDAATLFVKPDAEATQVANVYHITYPPNSTSWDGGSNLPGEATSIANFPDEAEYIVVLKASITAAEYLLAIEEDVELYSPIIVNLKNEYIQALNGLVARDMNPPKKEKGTE